MTSCSAAMIAACPAPSDEPVSTVRDQSSFPLASRNCAPLLASGRGEVLSSLFSRFSMPLGSSTVTRSDDGSRSRISLRMSIAQSAGASFGPRCSRTRRGRLKRDRRLVAVREEDRVIAEAPDSVPSLVNSSGCCSAPGRQKHKQPVDPVRFRGEPHEVVPARPGRGRRVDDRRVVSGADRPPHTPLSARGRAATLPEQARPQ